MSSIRSMRSALGIFTSALLAFLGLWLGSNEAAIASNISTQTPVTPYTAGGFKVGETNSQSATFTFDTVDDLTDGYFAIGINFAHGGTAFPGNLNGVSTVSGVTWTASDTNGTGIPLSGVTYRVQEYSSELMFLIYIPNTLTIPDGTRIQLELAPNVLLLDAMSGASSSVFLQDYHNVTGLSNVSSYTPLGATYAPHTVTFLQNGGTGTMAPQIMNGTQQITSNTFVRSGYEFIGWIDPSSNVWANNDYYTALADVSLTAQWKIHEIYFDANDGSLNPAVGGQSSDVDDHLVNIPFTRSGYTFAGWNTEPTPSTGTPGTSYANMATYAFSTTTGETLYAQWTLTPAVVTPTPPAVPAAPAPVYGPTIDSVGQRKFDFGSSKVFELTGSRFDDLISATAGRTAVKLISNTSSGLKLDLGPLPIGVYDLTLKFKGGTLVYQDAVTVVDPKVAEQAAANRIPKQVVKKPAVVKKSPSKKAPAKKAVSKKK